MKRIGIFLLLFASLGPTPASAQAIADYRLALPDHKGQLTWSIDGFKVVENSAKPNGREIGVRGQDASKQLTFLGFLFLAPETAPMSSAKCRDAALAQEKSANATLKIARTSETPGPGGLPLALVEYTNSNRDGSITYRVRGFVAINDICGSGIL